MTKLLTLALLSFAFVACASDVEEEETTTSSESLTCTRIGRSFRCVNDSSSKTNQSSKIIVSGSSGSKCSSLSVKCINGECTCRGNGGEEKACDGSNCQQVCCP